MSPEDLADLNNDAAVLATPGPREIRVSRFNAEQTRHYFRICTMYSSARSMIARNSMRRLYKAAGIPWPTWIAPELDAAVDGPLASAAAIRTPVRAPRFDVSPMLRRQAS